MRLIKMAPETSIPDVPAFDYVAGIEALCESGAQIDTNRDPALCFVCMQWACDGPHCHREGICPPEER